MGYFRRSSQTTGLIVDLSVSVKDGIDPSSRTLSYISVYQAADVVSMKSQGVLMAKIDTKSAYSIVPINSEDRHLQMVWEDRLYIDTALPFGPEIMISTNHFYSHSGCYSSEWFARRNGVFNICHYFTKFPVYPPWVKSPSS